MMNYSSFKYVSTPTETDLSRGYVYTSDELNYLSTSSTNDFPFGESEYDAIEVSVMAVDGTELLGYTITSSLNYTPYTRSFINVNNVGITYSCSLFKSDFVLVGTETRSLFVDVAQLFNNVELTHGTYKLGIDPVRYLVGSPTDTTRSLIVREISPSGNEISVSPTILASATESINVKFNTNYNAFVNNKFLTKQLVAELLSGIESPSIYNAYYQAYTTDRESAESIKQWYSFIGDIDWKSVETGSKNIHYLDRGRSDVSVIQFITDIYYGVKRGALRSDGQLSKRDVYGIYDQFKNTLFQNYETITTFSELREFYYSLFVYILDRELNQLINTRPANMVEVVGFFKKIIYDSLFAPTIDGLEIKYSESLTGYLKNVACFSDGTKLPILNYTASIRQDASENPLLLLKFTGVIPSNIKVGSSLWITNVMTTDTVVQNTYLYSNTQIETIQLRGPNFLIGTETTGNGTANTSLETAIGVTGSLYDEVLVKLEAKQNSSIPLNIDYRYFENFVKFSSVEERLNGYSYKLDTIKNYRDQLAELEIKLSINPYDSQYLSDQKEINDAYNAIEVSMDGYETFLYNNPSWYSEHTNLYNGMTSGSLYDRDNMMSLQNNLPSYIGESETNVDYVTFVNMIGHYFDNLSAYITQFTEKNNPANATAVGISNDVVFSMLNSLGWEPETGKENLPLLLSTFSKADFDVSSSLWNMVGSMSETERNQTIWKRILNNLPYILKTKGTESAINALINCYGVPKNLISIKEYGGIENSYNVEQNSIYSFDETKYAITFAGSNEYLNLPWTGSLQSVEFSVSFDPTKTNEDGQIFRVVNCSNSWLVGVVRERGQDWGKVFFTIQDDSGNLLTTMTPRAPIFNGDTFTILICKQNLHSDFLLSPYYTASMSDLYPQRYDIHAIRSDAARTTFAVSSSILLSGSYNSQWRTGSNIYFGNYQQNTASLSTDPEAFFGTIDEIKLWEMPIDIDRYTNHAAYQGAYDSHNPDDTVNKSIVRVSIGYPIDLYSDTGVVAVNNMSFRPDFPTVVAVQFPPSTGSIDYDEECGTIVCQPGYPFQFKAYNLIQSVKLPNFGSNKFRSNKVNYVEPVLISSLSSDSRSTLQSSATTTTDSNKIGVFFSPTDSINSEIMKFFGQFEFGDLIGNPQDVYKKTYPNFEKFRKLYFDQGGGQMDYQTFMNMVRTYFDKSMFKYVQTLVPARTKTVTGILVEPSILERPKIQQKQVQHEIHRNVSTSTSVGNGRPVGTFIPQLTQSLDVKVRGTALYDDENRTFYNDRLDSYGFGIFADNGVAYYKGDYWRVDVAPIKKTRIVEVESRIPISQTTEFDTVNTNHGKYHIFSQSYESVNISRFPVLQQYPIEPTMILSTGTEFIFSGSIKFPPYFSPPISTGYVNSNYGTTVSPWTITIDGAATSQNVVSASLTGMIDVPIGIYGTVSGSNSINLNGLYNNSGNTFDGKITILSGAKMKMYFYTLTPGELIFTTILNNTRGSLFTSIYNKSYTYRRDLSFLNIPNGSRQLDGYHFTHYRFKRPMFNRKIINILNDSRKVVGRFKKGSQTQKTTIQMDGLLDNSPPVVITKTA